MKHDEWVLFEPMQVVRIELHDDVGTFTEEYCAYRIAIIGADGREIYIDGCHDTGPEFVRKALR